MTQAYQPREIVIDPMLMQQYTAVLKQYNDETDEIDKLKEQFNQLSEIETQEEAREFIYKEYPKFKDNTSFSILGVNYLLYDSEEVVRIVAWFTDEILGYEFE